MTDGSLDVPSVVLYFFVKGGKWGFPIPVPEQVFLGIEGIHVHRLHCQFCWVDVNHLEVNVNMKLTFAETGKTSENNQ